MTDEMCKKDIRGLLKTFGVMADEAIVGHIAKNPGVDNLNFKIPGNRIMTILMKCNKN